jgi:hypothetical protein
MQYRHVTIGLSLEGMSPKKFIEDLESDGFEPLYYKILSVKSSFFGNANPFVEYSVIKTRRTKEEVQEYQKIRDEIVRGRLSPELESKYIKLSRDSIPSFGELFKNSRYPSVFFSIIDSSSGKNRDDEWEADSEWENQIWVSCWTEFDKGTDLEEALNSLVTCILKILGSDKPIEELLHSDTFSVTHTAMLEKLEDYNLKQAIFEDKKSLYELISDKKYRDILIDFNKKTNIVLSEYLSNSESKEQQESIEKKLNYLSSQDLLDKSLIIICNKTNQWWNMTVPSVTMLKQLESAGVTCTSCGAKISDERIDHLFRISQKGNMLVSGSYWMVGKVVDSLHKLGCRNGDIYADVRYESEQIDVLAFVLSKCIVAELKDREFGLGDAYKFHGKVSRLRQRLGSDIIPVVITTKNIANEARKLLSEVSIGTREHDQIEYKFIEGLENLEPEMKKWVNDRIKVLSEKRMQDVFARFPAKLVSEAK